MLVQINKKDFIRPWKPGIYFSSDIIIYDQKLYVLNETIKQLYTSTNFEEELLNNIWLSTIDKIEEELPK